ncbi:MAG: 2-phosphosulfolactate phosphatase [Bacteroidota bacterium]
MIQKKSVEVCLSPDLLHLYQLEGKIAVIVDILRATSCMVAGIGSGVARVIPVAKVEYALAYRPQGYILAGERNGEQVEGFDIGNSPFEYMKPEFLDKTIVTTTTNGTQAISKSQDADQIIIGSFLNISSISDYLTGSEKDVVIVCAGWKGRVNLEDSLFAGALYDRILDGYESEDDSVLVSQAIYREAKHDKLKFLQQSSHVLRLRRLNIGNDIEFCMREDEFDVVPYLKGKEIIKITI